MWICYLIKREIIERWLPSPSCHVENKNNTVTWKPGIGSSPDSRSTAAWPWASSCQLCEKTLLFRSFPKTSSSIIRDRICLESENLKEFYQIPVNLFKKNTRILSGKHDRMTAFSILKTFISQGENLILQILSWTK